MAAGFLSVSGVREERSHLDKTEVMSSVNQSQKWYLIGLLQLEAVTTASPCSREGITSDGDCREEVSLEGSSGSAHHSQLPS